VVLFPFLLMTWTVWHIQRWLVRTTCWHEVAPGLYLGRRAFPAELPEKIEMVVDLAAEFPAPRAIRAAAGYRSMPTLDAMPPADRDRALELVDEVAAFAGPVYVHCANGRGRSAVFVAAVLIAKGLAADSKVAMAMLRTARSSVHTNRAQLSWLRHLRKSTQPPATNSNALEA
jgi:protein-tyrosine phosphatase